MRWRARSRTSTRSSRSRRFGTRVRHLVGAALSLEAAKSGLGITKLALYEAPFIVDDSRAPLPDDYLARLKALVAANRRADAVRFFMEAVGVPAVFVFVMRFMPAWPKLKAIAHTM